MHSESEYRIHASSSNALPPLSLLTDALKLSRSTTLPLLQRLVDASSLPASSLGSVHDTLQFLCCLY